MSSVRGSIVAVGCAAVWRSHPREMLFSLVVSLAGMAATIVAEEGARCRITGMIVSSAG